MTWSYKITKVNNGYIIESVSDEDYEDKGIQVIEENNDELEAMKSLLYEIKELFGCNYSKHDKRNLVIEIEGDEDDEEYKEAEQDEGNDREDGETV